MNDDTFTWSSLQVPTQLSWETNVVKDCEPTTAYRAHSIAEFHSIMSTLLQIRHWTRHPRAPLSPQQLSIAAWNVRGLAASLKRHMLGEDCEHYQVDIACIQETKVTMQSEQTLHTGHKLILMQQKHTTQHGLGFVISSRLLNHVISYEYRM